VDIAYVFANSYHSADSSKNLLIERLYELRQRTLDGDIIIPNNELYIKEPGYMRASFDIYPNPARDLIYIKNENAEYAEYRIVNTLGTLLLTGIISSDKRTEININGLQSGFYIIYILNSKGSFSSKFIKGR